jgi:adenosylcobinamide-GDP ribazoletransferase
VCDIALLALVTRGLHLDGLADMADAVASGADRDRALEIMRDSTNGALGILAMLMVVLIKMACAIQLSAMGSWEWLVLVPCFSRTGLVILGVSSCYARASGGLGESFAGKDNWIYLLVALPTALASAWALKGAAALVSVGGVVVVTLAVSRWAMKRFGGVTGDILGAHVELQEMLLFLVAVSLK